MARQPWDERPREAPPARGSWRGPAGHMLRLVGLVVTVAGVLASAVVWVLARTDGITVASLVLVPGNEPHSWLEPGVGWLWTGVALAGVLAVVAGSLLARDEPIPTES